MKDDVECQDKINGGRNVTLHHSPPNVERLRVRDLAIHTADFDDSRGGRVHGAEHPASLYRRACGLQGFVNELM